MQARTGYLSGSVYLRPPRRDTWWMRYRLPDGTDSKRKIGRAWTKRGRPPEGYFTERMAEQVLREFLDAHAHLSGPTPTFAVAADEYLRYCETDKGLRATTLRTYRNIVRRELKPEFGDKRISQVSVRDVIALREKLIARGIEASTLNQHRTILVGIYKRARRAFAYFGPNPATEFDRARIVASQDFDVYSVEEVEALARAASSDGDAALFRCAAYTGLRRSELLALRWRHLRFDLRVIQIKRGFTEESGEELPKSHKVRTVPLVDQAFVELERLSRRPHFTRPDDLVFCNVVGEHMDGSALFRRYRKAARAAGLRDLPFHDLRHTFGTIAIAQPGVSVYDIKVWMGHANVATTEKYLHHAPQASAAERLSRAFVAGPRVVPDAEGKVAR
jgi:integrase